MMFDVSLQRTVNVTEAERVKIRIPVTVHPSRTGVVVINSHGLGGSKDGYNNKYVKIAEHLRNLEVGSVIRHQSSLFPFAFQNVEMNVLLEGNLRAVMEYAIKDAYRVCGSYSPVIYLAGFSAGASVSAAVAHAYPQVTKMLLISPSADVEPGVLKRALSKYLGELYITSGDNDYVVSPEAAGAILKWAEKAKARKIITVPNCDHQFIGERNGRILSKAYLWAFNGDKTYPSPDGGIKLY